MRGRVLVVIALLIALAVADKDDQGGSCSAAASGGGGGGGGDASDEGCGCGKNLNRDQGQDEDGDEDEDDEEEEASVDEDEDEEGGDSDENFKKGLNEVKNHLQDILSTPRTNQMIRVVGGTYTMGSDTPIFVADGEAPARRVSITSFFMDGHETSNAEFARFVLDSGYVTEAERFGDSFVMENYLSPEVKATVTQAVQAAPWWLKVS